MNARTGLRVGHVEEGVLHHDDVVQVGAKEPVAVVQHGLDDAALQSDGQLVSCSPRGSR